MKVLDTSVAVDNLRGRRDAVELLERILVSGETVSASEVVRFELHAGVRDEGLPSLESLCDGLVWLPVTEDVARTGGALARRYRRSYSGIDDADYLIAATALIAEADLLTTNVRQFPMFENLRPPY